MKLGQLCILTAILVTVSVSYAQDNVSPPGEKPKGEVAADGLEGKGLTPGAVDGTEVERTAPEEPSFPRMKSSA